MNGKEQNLAPPPPSNLRPCESSYIQHQIFVKDNYVAVDDNLAPSHYEKRMQLVQPPPLPPSFLHPLCPSHLNIARISKVSLDQKGLKGVFF